MNKRQITNLFKKVVNKIGTERDMNKIEDILNNLDLKVDGYGFGNEELQFTCPLGEYTGTLTKKELFKNDSYFRSLQDIIHKDAYLELYEEEGEIKIYTYVDISYHVCYGSETQTIYLNEVTI